MDTPSVRKTGGFHDGRTPCAVPAGVPPRDRRAGPLGPFALGDEPAIRALCEGDPKLGQTGDVDEGRRSDGRTTVERYELRRLKREN